MNRRCVLRALTSGLALASSQNLLPKGSSQTNQGSPGLLSVQRGSQIAISIFRSEQSVQSFVIKSLAARFGRIPGKGGSAALLASTDGTRAIVYKSGPPGPENAAIDEEPRIATNYETHEYEMIYLSQKSNGKELSITTSASPITLINAFSTSRDRQQQLVETWIRNAPDAEAFPGFEAAALHCSSHGTSVVNFAQWQSQEDWMTMAKALSNTFREKNPLGQADPHLYRAVCIA
ncbi:antibiotic biosynthesis monooxygenase family protein [Tunturiibacter psychrotolerans]|uniref:antibiotic biosynthesis monooxygenase family protein n=1 Tax=Tunturiibacter psychrotolerans TaxID=3069686 RepID=UPI003D239D0F